MEPITDQQLDEWAQGNHMGYRNSVDYLRPLSPEQRAEAIREANVIENTTPGYRFSSAVAQACRNVLSGDMWGRERADALMAYDPTGEKAAHHFGSWESFVRKAERA